MSTGQARVAHIMGMPVSIVIRTEGIDAGVVEECFDLLRGIDAVFSLWRDDTPMSRLARGDLALADCPDVIEEVLELAEQARLDTGGRFDIRAPSGALDPTGIVKGFAIARAGELLDLRGARDWCINAAGDVLVRGRPAPGRPWSVGVVDPADSLALLSTVRVTDGAVATSGLSERGHHIWDPRTGAAVTDVLAATIVCRDIVRADVLATAVVAGGAADGLDWIERLDGVEGLLVPSEGSVRTTTGWPVDGIPTEALRSSPACLP